VRNVFRGRRENFFIFLLLGSLQGKVGEIMRSINAPQLALPMNAEKSVFKPCASTNISQLEVPDEPAMA
jgi:hypothetical protein